MNAPRVLWSSTRKTHLITNHYNASVAVTLKREATAKTTPGFEPRDNGSPGGGTHRDAPPLSVLSEDWSLHSMPWISQPSLTSEA
ncbi:hypothetical protein CTRI78_v006414 [Colletotrichum trifolii]|uniref:Uncharacterized protein n=1 Tax=Colletotrichum trifolii TaxID=5466 RepID=A0A4R8RFP6_COLTR|nr:hypothetical protein CTRI78_v006414 [Colletotrichum trifolii]